LQRLTRIVDAWHEIEPSELTRENAVRFLRVLPLRAEDALQLCRSIRCRGTAFASLAVITLDERLAPRCGGMGSH
jgi:hypothetical protein